jgi:uncharacterized protein YdcH (DUF465 family)
MKTFDIREKLHHYIDTAEEKKIKAIFAMVEEEIEETYPHWNDEAFIQELKEREDRYIKGATKSYTIDQTIKRAREAIKTSTSKL